MSRETLFLSRKIKLIISYPDTTPCNFLLDFHPIAQNPKSASSSSGASQPLVTGVICPWSLPYFSHALSNWLLYSCVFTIFCNSELLFLLLYLFLHIVWQFFFLRVYLENLRPCGVLEIISCEKKWKYFYISIRYYLLLLNFAFGFYALWGICTCLYVLYVFICCRAWHRRRCVHISCVRDSVLHVSQGEISQWLWIVLTVGTLYVT